MILEHLITAYLDGELTPEQDRELRQNLAADPAAREAFDAAVLIHIALRCEDRTLPPPDLRASVFDAVDVIAAEESRLAGTTGVATRPIRFGNRTTTLLACLLLVFSVPIADRVLVGYTDSQLVGYTARQLESNTARQLESETTGQLESYTASQLDSYTDSQLDSYTASQLDDKLADELTSSLADSVAQQLPLSTLMGGLQIASSNDEVAASPLTTEHVETLPVHVTTAYAAGMGSSVPGTADVQQISASLAYGVTEKANVGLEVGSTSYSMTRTVTLMSGHAARSSSKPVGVTDGGKLSSPGPSGADYEASLSTVQTSERQMWATAFYEHKLFSLNDLSVNGRVAAGVAEDGLLGYGRLMGEWKLGGVASIIAGAEARTMPFRTTGASGTTTYGSVVTLLTGIHFRF